MNVWHIRTEARYKYLSLFLIIILVNGTAAYGQRLETFNLAVKTNLLSSALAKDINVGVEFLVFKSFYREGPVITLNLPVSYSPFTFPNNRKIKHIAFQPELRIWNPMPFEKAFIGFHAVYAYYNVGGINLPFRISPDLNERRYQGQLFGAGISAGYDLVFGGHFSLEASLGAGYAYMDHEVFKCETCGTKIKDEKRNYLGPTKAVLAIVYIIK